MSAALPCATASWISFPPGKRAIWMSIPLGWTAPSLKARTISYGPVSRDSFNLPARFAAGFRAGAALALPLVFFSAAVRAIAPSRVPLGRDYTICGRRGFGG